MAVASHLRFHPFAGLESFDQAAGAQEEEREAKIKVIHGLKIAPSTHFNSHSPGVEASRSL